MIDVFDGELPGFVYTRYGNPTIQHVERKLAAIEGGESARLFASGMAAIHAAVWTSLDRGGRLLTANDLYGGTNELLSRLLPRLGVDWERVDLTEPEEFARALRNGPTALYFETPTNPLLRLVDGPATVQLARHAGVRVLVDNTFATPVLQNPLEWGADLVIHSATKYLGGHSDLTLGAVVVRDGSLETIDEIRRCQGAVADPFAAWLLNRGLMTLAARIRAQSASALSIAEFLHGAGGLEKVYYPGLEEHPGHAIAKRQMSAFGGVLAVDLPGDREGALRFMSGLRTIRLGASLGGVESMATHPATSSHRMISPKERGDLGIREGLVRISIGLEEIEDLLDDIGAALRQAGARRG